MRHAALIVAACALLLEAAPCAARPHSPRAAPPAFPIRPAGAALPRHGSARPTPRTLSAGHGPIGHALSAARPLPAAHSLAAANPHPVKPRARVGQPARRPGTLPSARR